MKHQETTQSTNTGLSNQKTQEQNKENYSKISIVEGLPFAIYEKNENEYIIMFGKFLITNEIFKTKNDAIEWLGETNWIGILNVCGILVEEILNIKKLNNE